jgi:hypothetical protein
LHAKTDSEERFVRSCVFPQNFDELEFAEIFHCLAESADTGQNEGVAGGDGPRIVRNDGAAIE